MDNIVYEYGDWNLVSLERHNEGFGSKNKDKWVVDRDQTIIKVVKFGNTIFRSIHKINVYGTTKDYFTINGHEMTGRGIEGIRSPFNNIEKSFWGITTKELDTMLDLHYSLKDTFVFEPPRDPEDFTYIFGFMYSDDSRTITDFKGAKKYMKSILNLLEIVENK